MAGLRDVLQRLKGALDGGSGEFHRDDLLRRVEDATWRLRTFGSRGAEEFPPAVRVRVSARVPDPVRGWVEDPSFDRDLDARLLNRMVQASREALPLRSYEVEAADLDQVEVVPDAQAAVLVLRIEGGDRDGEVVALPAGRREVRLGRGPWHGRDERVPNDVVLTAHQAFVSRAAAILYRSGACLEVVAREQGECLEVVRAGGARVRPVMDSTGRTRLQAGDCLVFNDGGGQAVTVRLEAGCTESPKKLATSSG